MTYLSFKSKSGKLHIAKISNDSKVINYKRTFTEITVNYPAILATHPFYLPTFQSNNEKDAKINSTSLSTLFLSAFDGPIFTAHPKTNNGWRAAFIR